MQPLKSSSWKVRLGGSSLKSSWSRGHGVLGGGGGEGRINFCRLGCLWKLLARWLRCLVVEVGKLAVLGSELLHRPSCAEDVLLPGLDKRGSLGVPIPGDDISQARLRCSRRKGGIVVSVCVIFCEYIIQVIQYHTAAQRGWSFASEVSPGGHCSHQLTATMVPQWWARRTATNAHVTVVRKKKKPMCSAARLLHGRARRCTMPHSHFNFSWTAKRTQWRGTKGWDFFTSWFCYADYRSQNVGRTNAVRAGRSILVRPANKLQYFPRFRRMVYKVGIIHSIELWGKTSNSKRVITCAGALFI